MSIGYGKLFSTWSSETGYSVEPNLDIENKSRKAYENVKQPIKQQIVEKQILKSKGVFDNDSTAHLIKKFFVYKLMGSELFINHSLTFINVFYKILGIRLTNFAINNSVASLFTSGETV